VEKPKSRRAGHGSSSIYSGNPLLEAFKGEIVFDSGLVEDLGSSIIIWVDRQIIVSVTTTISLAPYATLRRGI
jgi:hypothetical protein